MLTLELPGAVQDNAIFRCCLPVKSFFKIAIGTKASKKRQSRVIESTSLKSRIRFHQRLLVPVKRFINVLARTSSAVSVN